MRIELQNLAPAPASVAPRAPEGSAAVFMGLLSGFGRGGVSGGVGEEREIRPEGAAARAHRELTDPLGLATQQAMTSPSAPATVEAARASANGPGGLADPADPARDTNSGRRPGVGVITEPETTKPGDAKPAVRSAPAAGHSDQTGAQQGEAGVGDEGVRPGAGGEPRQGRVSADGGRAEPGGAVVNAGTAVSRGGPVGGGGGADGKALPGALPAAPFAAKKAGAKPFASILRHEKAEIAPQVANGLATLLDRMGGRMQIQLRPEALGRVSVDLTIRDGVVHARLDAEHEQARQLLGNELDRLRLMLEHRGLRVERLEIVPHEQEARGSTGRQASAEGGFGTEADGGSPGGGDRHGARGGDPHGRAERRHPFGQAGPAEPGARPMDGVSPARWNPVVVRLDTMA